MRPIPFSLLPHWVTVMEKNNDSRYGGEFKEPIIINNVRVEPSDSVVKTGPDEEKVLKGMLFIDVVNSSPVIELKPESKVVFEGKEMTVQSVKPVYAFTLHHYEVSLI